MRPGPATVMAITVIVASVVAILKAVVDIAYGFIDLRLRDQARKDTSG